MAFNIDVNESLSSKFYHFINASKPVYAGTNEADSKQVEVQLTEWHKRFNFGSAFIKPYLFTHCWGEPSDGKICFNFDVSSKTLSFVEDSYAEREKMAVMVSEDFKILKIWDAYHRNFTGELKLQLQDKMN